MPIYTPDQQDISLGNSRINPADTYVRQTPQDVSSGFEALSRALSNWGSSISSAEEKAKLEAERLENEKIPYYISQFSQEMEAGTVDEVQVGKKLPQRSQIIVAKVTEGIGARQWEDYSRNYMEEALRNDESIRTDPVKRKAFFDKLRSDMVEQTRGRDFYGAGASRAVEGIINEFEGNFQREGAKVFQDQQEAEFTENAISVLKNPPASGEYGALLDFISTAESNGNYNAYYGNSGNTAIKFTDMTLAQVMQWQRTENAKGNNYTAVGKYQFIPKTLRGAIEALGLNPETTKFTPEIQDRLAEHLLKVRGIDDFISGKISKEQFANNLALEWAGLPAVSGDNAGKSAYHKDGINKSNVSVSSFLEALDKRGPSGNRLSGLDEIYAKTSGINPARRREIIVDSVVKYAVDSGDESILDRLEADTVNKETGQSYLLESHRSKIEKARSDLADVKYRRFTQNLTLQEKAREEENRMWRNDMTTRYLKGQPIDLVKDATGPDGLVDSTKRKFLDDLENSARVSSLDSAEASSNFEDALLSASTFGGSFKDLFKNDIVLGPIVQNGGSPSPDEIRDHIIRRTDINPADKEKLVAKVDTLLQGVSLMRDPDISTAYKEGVGMDVDAFIKNVQNTPVVYKNPTLASSVQNAYMGEIKRQVKADIEDGKGVPRGNRKLEIIDKAQEKAKAKLQEFFPKDNQASNTPAPNNTPQPSPPEKPKGRWETVDGIKRWIPN